jgi:tetratricopeptide (TPR) repeat protein
MNCNSFRRISFFNRIRLIIVTGLSLITVSAEAQVFDRMLNPKVDVNLTHPPGFGIKVNKIAFGPATGTCSEQIVDALLSDFVTNNVEVIDRSNLNTILSEHKFTLSGSVDQTSAAKLGKILGPSILLFVNVQRCAAEQDRLYEKETKYDKVRRVNYIQYSYIARTRVFLKLSVRTVDLATGRIFAAKSFDYSPQQVNKSYDGYPEFPASYDIQDYAFKCAVNDIHKLYFPWNERRSLYFFDDKDYGLKQAYRALSNGNLDEAFSLSEKNLEAVKKDEKAKPKFISHANYNLGMCYMLKSEYDMALQYLNEANKVKSGSIISEAITDCEKAKSLSGSMQKVEDKANLAAQQSKNEEEKNLKAETSNTLTNKSIVDMVKLKLPDGVIIQKIKSSKCDFDTTPEGLAILTKAGVKEKIMMAMIEK